MSENPDELYDYDPDVADQIAEKGIYVDPTLALSHLNNLRGRVKRADSGAMADPERRRGLLARLIEIEKESSVDVQTLSLIHI